MDTNKQESQLSSKPTSVSKNPIVQIFILGLVAVSCYYVSSRYISSSGREDAELLRQQKVALETNLVTESRRVKELETNNFELKSYVSNYQAKLDEFQNQLAVSRDLYNQLSTNKIFTNTVVMTNTVEKIVKDVESEEKLQSQIDDLNKQIQIAIIELSQKEKNEKELTIMVNRLTKERDYLLSELNDLPRLRYRVRKLEYEQWLKKRSDWVRNGNTTLKKGVETLHDLQERSVMEKVEQSFTNKPFRGTVTIESIKSK
jgi:hypothetical protein